MSARSMGRCCAAAVLAAMVASCAEAPIPQAPFPATPAPPPAAPPDASLSVVEGVVRAADGRAIDGALVAVVPAGDGDLPVEAGAETSHDGGLFRIAGIKPGKYGITATAPGHTGAYVSVFQLAAGETHGGVDVKLGGEGITFSGVVLDAGKRPVEGTIVRAVRFSEVGGDVFLARPDAAGAFRVTVPKASYELNAAAPRHEASPVSLQRPGDHQVALTLVRAYSMSDPAPPEVVPWLRQNAVPLTTAEAEHGFADMKPIRDIVGNARVVSLGEATHGTREFFQLKHRMLEYLVTEMGFEVFGIEASFPEALVVNDYVLHGKGDAAAAIAGMGFWTWDTEEVLALVEWMRRYNQDPKHPRKLRFHGFDMQSPAGSAQALLTYLRKVDPKNAAEDKRALEVIDDAFSVGLFASMPDDDIKRTLLGLTVIRKRFDERREEYVRRSDEQAYKLARLHASVALQGAKNMLERLGGDLRDRAMGENVLSILDLEGPKTKMVLWGHNGHVTRAGNPGWQPMGEHLDRKLGRDQVIFGFAFDRGSFQANELPFDKGRGLMTFTAPPAPEGSLDGTLAKVEAPIFALDMRRAPEASPAGQWLGARLFTRSIGSGYGDTPLGHFISQVPRNQYDALLFVASTNAARAKPTTRRGRSAEPPAPAPFTNGTFEEGVVGEAPKGWSLPEQHPPAGFRALTTEERCKEGKRCGMLTRDPSPWFNASLALRQRVDAAPYRGKRVRFRAAVRADVRGVGSEAHLYIRADRKGGAGVTWTPTRIVFANTHDRPIVDKAWQTRDLEIDVPENADVLGVGLGLAGTGRAWIDDASLTVVGDAKK